MASDKNTPNSKPMLTFKQRLIKKIEATQDSQAKFIEEKHAKLVQEIPGGLGSISEAKYEQEPSIDPGILDGMSEKDLKQNVKELIELNSEVLKSKKEENISDDKKLILKGLLEEITDIKKIFLENSFKKINDEISAKKPSKKQHSPKSPFQR